MINRREFLGITAGAGAALALSPDLLGAFEQSGKLIQRAMPSTGEMFPVISFAPRPFDGPAPTAGAPLREVLKTHLDRGGKVIDVLHAGPEGEDAARAAAAELGIQDKFSWTTVVNVTAPPQPGAGPPPMLDAGRIKAAVEEKLARFKATRVDLAMIPAAATAPHFAAGTRTAAHMIENLNAGAGSLPDEAMRKRMAQVVDALPPPPPPGPGPEVKIPVEVLDRYVGEYVSEGGFVAIFRREGDKLVVKPGNNPEAALIGRAHNRLQDPRGPVFEFEVDSQGKVVRAYLDQETPKGLQRIVLQRK